MENKKEQGRGGFVRRDEIDKEEIEEVEQKKKNKEEIEEKGKRKWGFWQLGYVRKKRKLSRG